MPLSEAEELELLELEKEKSSGSSLAGHNVSKTESALRGGAQGLSLGFADELVGGAGAAGQAIKKLSVSDIVKDYIANRDQYRAADEAAKKSNPKIFGASEIAGGITTAFVPGLNIAKGATLGARAAGAAGLGALASLGTSKADLTKGDFAGAGKDVAIGAALGGFLQPAAEKAIIPAVKYAASTPLMKKVFNKGLDIAAPIGKKAVNVAFDVPETVQNTYLKNPEAVNNALSKEQLGQKIADTLGEVRSDTSGLNNAAMTALSSERQPIAGLEITSAVDRLRKFKDPDAHQLADRLENEYLKRTGSIAPEANPGYLTQEELHEVKSTLQGLTDFKKPLPSAEQAMARNSAGEVNSTLKGLNPDYSEAMGDLSDNINLKNGLAKKFGVIPDYKQESGYTFSDRTVPAIDNIVKGNKFEQRRIVEELEKQGYGDLGQDVQNTLAKQTLDNGRTNGSRRAVVGGAIGSAIGHFSGIPGGGWTGYALGASAGAAADKYGGQMAKKALDAGVIISKLRTPEASKFQGAIMNAGERGPKALAATHFLLSQTEPAYQAAMQEDGKTDKPY